MLMRSKMFFCIECEEGQALVEAPIVVGILTCMIVMLIQPCLCLTTRAMVGYAAACLARVDATATTSAVENPESIYRTYIEHKLGALPKGSYFYIPSSLSVTSGEIDDGNKRKIEISVKQKPLPLFGALLAESDGLIHISEKTLVHDSLAFSLPTEKRELVVGAE